MPTDRPRGPSPGELWRQAGGDADRYRELMREHGYLVPGTPEPLPCGWMPGGANRRLTDCPDCVEHLRANPDLPEACTAAGAKLGAGTATMLARYLAVFHRNGHRDETGGRGSG